MIKQLLKICGLLFIGCQTVGDSPSVRPVEPVWPGIQLDKDFRSAWWDGKAEVAGYEIKVSRYGEIRSGTAVSVFVSENFDSVRRVKSDYPKADSTEFPVIKYNWIEDFQTGIYDYNLMTSAFVAMSSQEGRPAGSLTKVSFSAQEWCGHAYHQLLFDNNSIRETIHSYFDGEADQDNQLPYPADGISEDALLFWARGMAVPTLLPGEQRSVQMLTSLKYARFHHVAPSWRPAVLSRSQESKLFEVPAGKFEVEEFTASIEGGLTYRFLIEKAPPHHIIHWETSAGDKGDLLATKRLSYWNLHDEGMESYLSEIGLAKRPARTP